MSDCKKCGTIPGTILLRQKDLYCTNCFLANVNHKFRACIGKNRILSHKKQIENVLICLSGGPGSAVMSDLVCNAVTLNNHKKLGLTPIFFHIISSSDDMNVARSIITACNKKKHDIYLCHISEYLLAKKNKPIMNDIPIINKEADTKFRNLLNDMSSSTKNDYLIKIKRELFIWYAKELLCNIIFTAETSSTLAVNLISNLSLGRGSQVQHDIGFCDSRNDIKILRPLKEITFEELQHYININKLELLKEKAVHGNSLQSVIKLFVHDLQDNYQSTISTICKTAEKIGIQDDNNHTNKCSMCESCLSDTEYNLSALEATNYSRTVSIDQEKAKCLNNPIDQHSMFPHVKKYLCYTCSKNYLEIDPATLPVHFKHLT
ncbi:unnamed protein product [Diatraea saccharalis]|uniref:Cytoplasmic tRNA 2-thiolation protein 2 n=1 Tax=Diatraea saccharalis TaxID=40085 RepID=A0A9N9RF53_9NEOP|nr:unnamed protein product [Diatraea saccharalis]